MGVCLSRCLRSSGRVDARGGPPGGTRVTSCESTGYPVASENLQTNSSRRGRSAAAANAAAANAAAANAATDAVMENAAAANAAAAYDPLAEFQTFGRRSSALRRDRSSSDADQDDRHLQTRRIDVNDAAAAGEIR